MAKRKKEEDQASTPISKMSLLMKEWNEGAGEEIMSLGISQFDYDRIPFTSPRMNWCTYGGIPVGKVIEFYGPEHGGKTTSALDGVANFQHSKDTRRALYVDAENRLDLVWARKLGVDVENMWVIQPKGQDAETVFDMVCKAVETGEIGLWVIDSLAMLMSKQEWEKEMDETTYGGISKPLTKFSKKIEMLNARYKCTGIGINQERDDLKSMWGGTKTPGGRAWKYACSMRLKFSRGKFIDSEGKELPSTAENPAGNIVLMSMTKSTVCPPNRRTGFYTIDYLIGIDYLKDLVDVAMKNGIVDKSGSWFEIVDVMTGDVLADKIQGQAKLYSYLEDNIEVLKRVEELVEIKMNED